MQAFSLFSAVYATAPRSGFLNTRPGSNLFIEAYFQYKKRLEDPFEGFLERYPQLLRGGHALDVGANIGYCASLFSRALDPGFRVYAFEPEPFNVSLLERVIRTRCQGEVIPVQAAVGAAEGEIHLQLNPRHHGDHHVVTGSASTHNGSISVPLVSIDAFLERSNVCAPVSFLKIDVQGYEFAVCQGAGKTLAANPGCSIVLEYMPQALESLGFHADDLPRWFEQRGYRPYVLHKDGHLSEGMPANLGVRGYADLLFRQSPLP